MVRHLWALAFAVQAVGDWMSDPAEMAEAEIERLMALNPPRNPRRPKGFPRSDWFHMSREFRALHYRCCHEPAAAFLREEAEKGKDFWMREANK